MTTHGPHGKCNLSVHHARLFVGKLSFATSCREVFLEYAVVAHVIFLMCVYISTPLQEGSFQADVSCREQVTFRVRPD